MTRFTKIAVLALAATALATGIAAAQPYGGGRGMGPGMGMGMGPGGGPGGCPMLSEQAAVDQALTVEKVKTILETRLARHGNERLKVGKVAEKDAKTIVAEIDTVDGSLVQTLEIDKATGQGLFGMGRRAGLGYRGQTPPPKVQ